MPDDATAYFGSGTAGSVWKSMLAQQIAEQMAKHGGIGIANELAASMKTKAGAGLRPSARSPPRSAPPSALAHHQRLARGPPGVLRSDPATTPDKSNS